MQVEIDSEVDPSLAGPDIADVTRPFLVRFVCFEVPVQQVGRNVEGVIAVLLSGSCFA